MKKILILCTGNSCRSQIAEGYLRHYAPKTATVLSAGLEAHGVNPMAIQTMKEDGIDISSHTSNNLEEYYGNSFDFVITVCDNAQENCPFFPSKAQRFHYNFPDPAKFAGSEAETIIEFRKVRELIKAYIRKFVIAELED